jgi:hypothetical protein
MIDVNYVKSIAKQAQIDFCRKFEEDYPEFIEDIKNMIVESASNGDNKVCVIIDINKYDIFNAKKYLDCNEFYTKINPGTYVSTPVNPNKSGTWNKPLYDELEIYWK